MKTTASTRDNETRLEALEIKASFSEDSLERLNDVVVRQQQIDRLLHEVSRLGQVLAAAPEANRYRSLREEMPPHY